MQDAHIVPRHLFVKPAEGRVILEPNTGRALPEDGSHVVNEKYWRRRVSDGDVVIVDEPKGPAKRSNS